MQGNMSVVQWQIEKVLHSVERGFDKVAWDGR